ncbi:hypothetical protein pdam_00000109, partial [Pocillopora damicornis]
MKEEIEQPIIGCNVIELMVKNTEGEVDGEKLPGRTMRSFHQSRDSDTQALIKIGVRLSNENEAEVRVPFLVTKEEIEQPIIGYNVIELMVKNTEGEVDGEKLPGRTMKSFHQSRDSDIQALISIIRATNSDELCF